MAKYDVRKLQLLAKREGMKFKFHNWENDTQRIYDFDVVGAESIRRVKFVTFKNDRRLFPDSANVYVGRSSKYGLKFKSYNDLIKKIKDFKV